jgi:hypothetical protein
MPDPDTVCPIPSDLACAICSHNLKGLAPDGACPGCGQPISRSFALALSDAPPEWLRRQATTMLWLAVVALTTYASTAHAMTWRLAPPFHLVIAGLTLYAAWRLAAPEHDPMLPAGVDGAAAWRRALLATATFHVAFATLVFFGRRLLDNRLFLILGLTEAVAFVALHWIVARYLREFARRANDPPLLAHARLVFWVFPLQALAQAALPAFLFWLIPRARFDDTSIYILSAADWLAAAAALAYVLLLGRLHETLRAAAAAANRAAEVPIVQNA